MNSSKKLLNILLTLSGLIVSFRIVRPLFESGFLKFQGNITVDNTTYWMGVCSVSLLVILIGAIRVDKNPAPSNTSAHDRKLVKLSMICAAGLLIATGVFNIWVNPWDLYGTDYFPSRTNPARSQKLTYYSRIEKTPDLIIIGNSTAFTISPQYIKKKLGYSSFNWSVDAGRPAENRVLLEYIAQQSKPDFPKIILMQIPDKYPLTAFYDRMPMQFLSYLKLSEVMQEGSTRLAEAISISQWADSIYVIRVTQINVTKPWSGWAFDADGFGYKYNSEFSKAFSSEKISDYQKCSVPNVFRDENIENILALVDEHNSSIVFYIGPLLPEFYDGYLKDTPKYQQCHQTIVDYFTELSRTHSNVFFQDYLASENMQGLDGPEGFYDELHLKPENAERLTDALADTLQQAYAAAAAQRSTTAGGVE